MIDQIVYLIRRYGFRRTLKIIIRQFIHLLIGSRLEY